MPAELQGAATPGAPSDVIHDIGFRHYEGARFGRGWVVRSLLVETIRGVFGLGRPAKSKVLPWLLIAILAAPPLVIALLAVFTGSEELPVSYTGYLIGFVSLVTSLFVAGAAPYCVSRDLRHGVMPLYLSRPIRRNDYVLAKFGGLAIAVFAVLALAQTLLLIGALLAKLEVGDQVIGWAGGLFMSALIAVVVSGVALVIAAFTPRRGLGMAAIITTLVVVGGLTQILFDLTRTKGYDTLASYLPMLDPFSLVEGFATRVLGVDPAGNFVYPAGATGIAVYGLVAAAVVVGAWLVLNRRYRKVGGV